MRGILHLAKWFVFQSLNGNSHQINFFAILCQLIFVLENENRWFTLSAFV